MTDYSNLEQNLQHLGESLRSVPSVQEQVSKRLRCQAIASLRRSNVVLLMVAMGALAATWFLGFYLGGLRTIQPEPKQPSASLEFLDQKNSQKVALDDSVRLYAPERHRDERISDAVSPWMHFEPSPRDQWGKPLPQTPINASDSPVSQDKINQRSFDLALMTQEHIRPTFESMTTYLRKLRPDPKQDKTAKKWIDQLSDEDYNIREQATKSLLECPKIPIQELHQAARSEDLEKALRAKRILKDPRVKKQEASHQRRPQVIAAVCRACRAQSLHDVVPVLLDTVSYVEESEEQPTIVDTIAALASPKHVPLFQKHLDSEQVAVKVAALRGLGRATTEFDEEIHRQTNDRDPRVALAAARALVERGDRSALAVLVKLMGSEKTDVRAQSVQILRALSGLNYQVNPFQASRTQVKQRERWQKWLAEESRTARLNLPLRLQPLVEDIQKGLLLHYTFDADAGKRLRDVSGHNHHGKVYNAHSFAKGISGKALQLRGAGYGGPSGGHALLPYLDFTKRKQFTIALWVNEKSTTDKHGEAYVVFGADRGVGIEDSLGISHFNNELIFRIGGGSIRKPFNKNDLNRWVHYALTFQNGWFRGYKNGQLLGEAQGHVSVVGKHAALGRHWWGHGDTTSTRFVGAFDDVRIYNRALSLEQLRQLYASIKP